jgi:tetratricopeptide (TPR) repeat protein
MSEGPESRDRAKEPPWAPPAGPRTRRSRDEVWILDEVIEQGPETANRARTSTRERPGHRTVPTLPPGGTHRPSRQAALPAEVVEEIAGSAGSEQAPRVAERLAAAANAYERDRYNDALRITRSVIALAPRSASALELHGLVCYRLGRWRDAVRYLNAAGEIAGADESQIPVLMDCHRALGHRKKVRMLWKELRASSPPADVLVEGRLVLAATLRDEGSLDQAIAELVEAGAARALRHPVDRHIRQWYLLADLYDRAGDLPRAREFFGRVVDADPELADAAERLAGLGRTTRRGASRPTAPKRSAAAR